MTGFPACSLLAAALAALSTTTAVAGTPGYDTIELQARSNLIVNDNGWNVPPGTIFRILLSESHIVTATARWCQEDRMGVEFSVPLALDDSGRIAARAPPSERAWPGAVRRSA